MTNKNTVINGLKNQIHDLRTYADDGEIITLTVDQAEDIVFLLEEQEPVKPTWSQGKAYCGNCGQRLPRKRDDRKNNYCGCCGQAVEWNG